MGDLIDVAGIDVKSDCGGVMKGSGE